MLKAVAPGPAIVVCNTCRHPDGRPTDRDGLSGGARLVAALRAAQAADAVFGRIAIQEMSCLFACSFACAVHLRAPGRIGYVLGRMSPDETSARALLDYAVAHAASADGDVAYGDWPEGVKGHFLTRTPPEGFLVE